MNIKQAKQEIINTVHAYLRRNAEGEYAIPAIRQRPVLLIGPPGIGKTQIMEQIARECQIGLVAYTITHHTRQSAVGLPFIREEEFNGKKYSTTEYTMSEIIASVYRKMKETGLKEGILFIDEINCVSETLAPTMLQFLQCKTFGNQKVPEGWIIVAAGNPPEYNKSVRDFDMVTLDRVRYINVEADYPVWREYARKQQINSAILNYLELKPNRFYKVEADVDGMQFVTARGWEDLSNLMAAYEAMNLPVTQDVVQEFLHHEEIAEDAAAYFDLYRKYRDDYGISDILEGKVSQKVYARIFEAAFDERLTVVNLLLDGLDTILRTYGEEKYRTDTWYAFLKKYKQKQAAGKDMRDCYFKVIIEEQEALDRKVQEEILTKKEIVRQENLLRAWRESGKDLAGIADPEMAFATAKKGFDEQLDRLELIEANITMAINHVFDFMESAFPEGQEMVVFVTGLSIHPDAALFLSENEVERYDKYKEQLLIGSRKAQIMDDLTH